jgi:hypothetical protein
MPAITVSLDGSTVATVCSAGYHILSVRVGGTRIDEDFADLDVTGGSYPEHGENVYLTWASVAPLKPGQILKVALLEVGSTSYPGKTIDELFPKEEPAMPVAFKPTAEVLADARATPRLREGYAFRYSSSAGTSFHGRTASGDHGFGFSVLWNWLHPERAIVSLHSYTIDDLEHYRPMNDHVDEFIHFGQSVSLEIDA